MKSVPGTVNLGLVRQSSRTGPATMLPGSARQQRLQPAAARQPGLVFTLSSRQPDH
jgi:hypothetical protein